MARLNDDEQVIYDITAEKSVIGLAMLFPDRCRQSMLEIQPDDWFHHRTRNLAIVVSEMLVANRPVNPDTVFVEAQSRGLVPARVEPAFIFECQQAAGAPEGAPELSKRIRNLSGVRKLSQAATRLTQRLDSAWVSGLDPADVGAAVAEVRRACDEAERIAEDTSAAPPTPMGVFLETQDSHDWLIPGMLERSERILLTGSEGTGKTVLATQLACCMAGGVHPFTGSPLGRGSHQIRVLIIDCENSPAQSRRRFRRMIATVDQIRHSNGLSPMDWSETMFIDMRPAGIDLLAATDSMWLERAITAAAPDLVVLGPLYKLHHENPSDETAARELVWVLDNLRERHGFALLTEAHAGNSTDGSGDRMMRPLGSSLFRRWPEFGFGLRRSKNDQSNDRPKLVDVVSWRGSREERAWPRQLQHSYVLPWMPANADYYDELKAMS